MKIELGCPCTLGEYNRLIKNLEVYDNINSEQKEWFESFMDDNKYKFGDVVLQLNQDVLWVIINTGKSVKEFTFTGGGKQ